jgi:hypothetical protein
MYGTRYASALRSVLLALLVAVVGSAVAQPVVPANVAGTNGTFGAWYFGGGFRAGTTGSGMVPMSVTPTNPTNLSGWTTAGNFGVAPEPTGVTFNASGPANVPTSKTPPTFNFKSAAQMAGVGVAVAGVLSKALGPIGLAITAYQVARELGFIPTNDPVTGAFALQKPAPGVCTVAPCFSYQVGSMFGEPSSSNNDMAAACSAHTGLYNAAAAGSGNTATAATVVFSGPASGNWSGYFCRMGVNGANFKDVNINQTARAVDTNGATVSAEMQQLIDAIANKSGWPATSAIAQATRDAIASGQTVPTGGTTVSGPASSPGPSTTTNNPDGTKVVTNVTNNYNYAGDTVTVTTTTTETTYNAANVATGTKTTTSEGEKPKTECEQQPDAVGCAKLDTPDVELPKATKNVPYASDNVNVTWGSGCPAPISIGTFGGGARQLEFTAFCDVATRANPFILAAGAFAAMLIVLYGVRGAS